VRARCYGRSYGSYSTLPAWSFVQIRDWKSRKVLSVTRSVGGNWSASRSQVVAYICETRLAIRRIVTNNNKSWCCHSAPTSFVVPPHPMQSLTIMQDHGPHVQMQHFPIYINRSSFAICNNISHASNARCGKVAEFSNIRLLLATYSCPPSAVET
jgi:hypothetical protein